MLASVASRADIFFLAVFSRRVDLSNVLLEAKYWKGGYSGKGGYQVAGKQAFSEHSHFFTVMAIFTVHFVNRKCLKISQSIFAMGIGYNHF